MKRDDAYYQAMLARDHRFDGKFFVGVKTTGIYCRPICPAKPKRENVEFFPSQLAAEKASYRPCMRCRPESAPQSPAWIGRSALVRRAIKILNTQESLEYDEDQFAAKFGVSARHLRRLFVEEVGKTPKQISFDNRLGLSRQLMTETSLSITEVAFASGFGSLRRFNDAFKERFKKSPSEIRRSACKTEVGAPVRVSLSYRPPYDFEGLLKSYQSHRVGDLEWIHDGKMHRVVSFDNRVGKISIVNDPANSQLIVDVDFPDSLHIHSILSRVRHLFDLHSDPLVIANALDAVPEFKKLLRASPGIRLPSGWDPFEVAIATILGQLVSVERGRRLVHDLIEIAGSESGYMVDRKNVRLFPAPEAIVAADLSTLKTTAARKKTLVAFCETLIAGQISLEPTQDIDQFIKQILSIKGIGPWTAQYIALKALRDTDAFPGSDLILARAVKLHSQATIDRVSPWRGYIAALMWRSHSGQKAKRELK